MPDAHPEPAPTPPPSDLIAEVYEELRAIAASHLRQERAGHTLQPTALVNEAYLRLAKLDRIRWRDRAHFLVAASGAIRRILVDHARARRTQKRGGELARVTLTGIAGDGAAPDVDLLALEEALTRLAALDERKARIVELRFFGGLTIAETADALGVGTTTVEDDWAFARSWLRRELEDDAA